MAKKILLLIFSLVCFLNSKEVLILHSYHKGYVWSDNISKAIEKNLKSHHEIELSTLYMNTKRINTPEYLQNLAHSYKKQLSNRKLDLLVVSDNDAFDFAKKYYDYIFKGVPIVFCGINNFNHSMLEPNFKNFTTGVVEEVDLEKNIALIHKLQPKLKKLLIINDTTKTGIAIKKDLLPIIDKYSKKFNIEYVDSLDMKELKRKIASLNKRHDAILTILLFKDNFTQRQNFKSIKKISKVPIYGLWDFYLNQGIIGGLLTSGNSQGEVVSKMIIELLHDKKSIKEISIVQKSPNAYIFDYNELKRFDIDIGKLENTILINEPSRLYKKYTTTFLLSLLVILSLTTMVLVLKKNIAKRKEIEKVLQNRIRFDKALLDTMPNPIYYKNADGIFLGCNVAFAELVQTSVGLVIGKSAHDFFPKEIADQNAQIDKSVLKDFKTRSFEFILHPNTKGMKHILLNKTAYKNIDGSIGGIVCVMNDITQLVQQKQFLIQQSKLAEMGDMIAAIAHQWNEPLVELSALVQDMQTSYMLNELKDTAVQEFVNESMVQIKYMSQTLSDFRNFLKVSNKKKLFSISKALNEINEIIGKQVFYLNIIMSFNYESENEQMLIYGYENEFKQVLLNIINNAKHKIKTLDDDKKYKIDINIKRRKHYNLIEICDNAGEIDKNIIDMVFSPYFTTKKNGTGLGLYMAKVLIEDKMQGKISVKNVKDGVIFSIKMPHNIGKK